MEPMKTDIRSWAAALLLWAPLAYAHHAMDSVTPETLLQGLLSGLAHPVIGLDHLAFIVAAGVLASTYAAGWLLPIVFVVASFHGSAFHVYGFNLPGSEWWIGVTLLLMAAVMVRRGTAYGAGTVVLFAVAGVAHGYALAESIVGAEATPLVAYFAGLIVIQTAVALGAYGAVRWWAQHRPALPLVRAASATAAIAGVTVIALALT
jgi:urease accessory protein